MLEVSVTGFQIQKTKLIPVIKKNQGKNQKKERSERYSFVQNIVRIFFWGQHTVLFIDVASGFPGKLIGLFHTYCSRRNLFMLTTIIFTLAIWFLLVFSIATRFYLPLHLLFIGIECLVMHMFGGVNKRGIEGRDYKFDQISR